MREGAGDRSWFEPLVSRFERPAFRFALMLVQDPALAEEIVQEAFARSWWSPRTPSNEGEFKRWLYRCITNLAHDQHRRRAIVARLPWHPASEPDPVDVVARRQDERELALALRSLSLHERQAVYLHYFEDLRFGEIARLLGGRESSVRVTVHRALAKLRRRLDPGTTPEEALA
jgi:RNA polymerase sigma-70 factor (ECF subfamily)